jgi:hypothetical protein
LRSGGENRIRWYGLDLGLERLKWSHTLGFRTGVNGHAENIGTRPHLMFFLSIQWITRLSCYPFLGMNASKPCADETKD